MRNIFIQRSVDILFGLILLLSCVIVNTRSAQAYAQVSSAQRLDGRYETMNRVTHAVVASGHGHVTSLVLDMSGSMSGNDPNKVRCAAADTYISLSRPGEFVGLIGLVNQDGRANTDGRFQKAEVWSPPIEMTYSGRQQLQQIIAARCSPTGNTPTYDALTQAYKQLSEAIGTSGMSGSVVVLTDGEPQPDPDQQISAIESELLPRFHDKGWHIDTVAIGTTETNFTFLQTISSETGGKYYDESQGKVATALNLMPLFVDIFQHEVGRTPGPSISQTPLDGGTSTQEFTVNPYADHLDVIVVYDTPGTIVTLKDPQGNVVPALPIISSRDAPQYDAVFSVDKPVATYNGSALIPWTLTVSGNGSFLMDSLLVSTLKVIIHSPIESALPLGQALKISATVNNLDGSLYHGQFAVIGTLTYVGGSLGYSQPLTLNPTSAQQYQTTVTVPATAPSGVYQLDVSATQTSGDNQIAAATLRLRLDLFPYPYLRSSDGTLTDTTAEAAVLRWPFWLQFYSLPILQWLSEWPLQGHPAQTDAGITGLLKTQDGSPYTKNAIVNAEVVRVGTSTSIPAQTAYDGAGHFHLTFPASEAGDYQVTFRTQGAIADSHGDSLATTRIIHLGFQDATLGQEIYAGGVTASYMLFLIFLYFYFRFCLARPPFGACERVDNGERTERRSFATVQRNPIQVFFRRNRLFSEEARLPGGLEVQFKHWDVIKVRPRRGQKRWRGSGQEWRYSDGNGDDRIYRTVTKVDERSKKLGRFWGVVFGVLGLLLVGAGVLFKGMPLALVGLLLAPLGLAFGLPSLLSRSTKKPSTVKRRASSKRNVRRPVARSRSRR